MYTTSEAEFVTRQEVAYRRYTSTGVRLGLGADVVDHVPGIAVAEIDEIVDD